MPNPPFQPLTLSVEEWKACDERARKGGNHIERLLHRECEAQAQEAASLRQRLEEAEATIVRLTADIPKTEKEFAKTATKHAKRADEAEATSAGRLRVLNEKSDALRASEIKVINLEAQLEQAQKERDAQAQQTLYQSELAEERFVRASQAEAALEEMREFLEINYAGLHEAAQVFRDVCLNVLERRRSTPGQEKA